MKIKQLKRLNRKELFLYWITERESIRKQRESGKEKPWTDDPIIQKFRFCNVRRMDDRVSKWIMKNWYEPNYDHPKMLTACTLARNINTIGSLEELGFPKKWNPVRARKILEDRQSRGERVFSNAYLVTGALGGSKIEQIVEKVVDIVHRQPPYYSGQSVEELWEMMMTFRGIGSFIAGQITADMRWAADGGWYDSLTFAPMGPGSLQGINLLHHRELKKSMKPEQFRKELSEVIEMCASSLPISMTSRLEAIDYQNCLCEYSKFFKAIHLDKNPKRYFK